MNIVNLKDPFSVVKKYLTTKNKAMLKMTGRTGKLLIPEKLYADIFYIAKNGNIVNVDTFIDSLNSQDKEKTQKIIKTKKALEKTVSTGDVVVYPNESFLNVPKNKVNDMRRSRTNYMIAFMNKNGNFVNAKWNDWEKFVLPPSLQYLDVDFFTQLPITEIAQVSFDPYNTGEVDVNYTNINRNQPIQYAENGFIDNVIKTQTLYDKKLKKGMKMLPFLSFAMPI